ncbi:hypothetical protein P8452_58860 [Trifolium repens]|nr:hypothetical protein P8452_58860 [Trifolium repens]
MTTAEQCILKFYQATNIHSQKDDIQHHIKHLLTASSHFQFPIQHLISNLNTSIFPNQSQIDNTNKNTHTHQDSAYFKPVLSLLIIVCR